MHRAWLLGVVLLATAVAGCTQQPSPPPHDAGGGTGVTGGLGGNATANTTAGNVSAGAGANATAGGNATGGNSTGEGNATAGGNATGNASAGPPPRQLVADTYEYGPSSPDDVTFRVDAGYRKLVVNASADGVLANLRVTLVDPDGNETVILEGTASAGGEEPTTVEVPRPAAGAWTLAFGGAGAGRVDLTVDAM